MTTAAIKMQKKNAFVCSVVTTYWVVSISMVYLNKMLMSSEDLSIPAPLFVTCFQCIITVFVCYLAGKNSGSKYTSIKRNSPKALPEPSFFSQFPKAEYNIPTALKILPLSIVFVAMITFNNLCLRWVEVSFYNVARSLTIAFNVIFSRVMLGIPTSKTTCACLAVVIFGFAMGTKGEVNFSVKGTIAGLLSSLFVCLNSIYTKKFLPVVDDNHFRLTCYNNINACFLFLPFVWIFERHVLLEQLFQKTWAFWVAMVVAGVFGFAIGIVTVLQIKVTSPLSHNISGTAKAAFQSMLAFRIWKNESTLMGISGVFVVLGGSLVYTWVKMKEHKHETKLKREGRQKAKIQRSNSMSSYTSDHSDENSLSSQRSLRNRIQIQLVTTDSKNVDL